MSGTVMGQTNFNRRADTWKLLGQRQQHEDKYIIRRGKHVEVFPACELLRSFSKRLVYLSFTPLEQRQYVGTRAKIIFGGKLRNPYFCHIFGMERPMFFLLLKKACISLA